MAYTPVPYAEAADVKRILRTTNNKIRIGDDSNDTLTNTDLSGYILEASKMIDAALMTVVSEGYIPLSNSSNYPEISFAAPRLTAYLIYRDIYQAYRRENLPMGPSGWFEDFKDYLKIFVDNLGAGAYPTLSPSVDGPAWRAVEQYFINKFGVSQVHDQFTVGDNQLTDASADNTGPWGDS